MTDTFDDAGADTHVEQLQPDDSLIDRGVADALDEGYTAPEKWSAAMSFGMTPLEERQGETLEMRLGQEEPELVLPDEDWTQGEHGRQVGDRRSGRLVDLRADRSGEVVAGDVGIDGGAASAEEAAMHVFDPDQADETDVEPEWTPEGTQ